MISIVEVTTTASWEQVDFNATVTSYFDVPAY